MDGERVDLHRSACPRSGSALVNHLRQTGARLRDAEADHVGRRGAAARPGRRLRANCGVEACQGWGMTETSPIVTYNTRKARDRVARRRGAPATMRSSRAASCSASICASSDDDGREAAVGRQDLGRPDGVAATGSPAPITAARTARSTTTAGFPPAMSAVIDEDGYMRITDRTKDRDQVGRRMDQLDRNSKTSRSAIPMSPRRRPSPRRTRNGANGRC